MIVRDHNTDHKHFLDSEWPPGTSGAWRYVVTKDGSVWEWCSNADGDGLHPVHREFTRRITDPVRLLELALQGVRS